MRIRQIEDLPVVASMLSQSEQQKIVGGVNVTRYAFIVRLFHSLLSPDFNRCFRSDPETPRNSLRNYLVGEICFALDIYLNR